ncbi:phytase [Pseudohaliea sp.]|uniref:phytase n=1 Tax=Pseudohaliea sp. TaxID=2740289 RepID=UPI0032EEA280
MPAFDAISFPDGAADLHAEPGAPGTWLVAAEAGLLRVSGEGTHLLAAGRFESLDARGGVELGGERTILVSGLDVDAGAVRLFAYDPATAAVTARLTISPDRASPDAACLARHGDGGDLTLFIVDARGEVQQRVVYDAAAGALVNRPLRRFPGVPEAEACAVDDAAEALYIAEEPVGVWRYDAAWEGDREREPALLGSGVGPLAGEATDLAVDERGGLWVLDGDAGALHYLPAGAAPALWPLADMGEPSALALAPGVDAVDIVVFDEAAPGHRVARIPLPPAPAATAQRRPPAIAASAETVPVARYGDAADDPAIYVPANGTGEPLVLGTDKRAGLAVYGLDGALRQFLAVGRLNNVDLLPAVAFADGTVPLAAASNRSGDSISLFAIEAGGVRHLGDVPTGLSDVYGLCMYAADDAAYVFVNATDGRYEQHRLGGTLAEPTAERVRAFRLPSQPEGCVADPVTTQVYLGEEAAGVWVAGAAPDGAAPTLVIEVGEQLVPDVEGMAIYRRGEQAWLVVSSQGSNSFAVYALVPGYPLVGDFRVTADLAAGIDGVSETDGLDVTSAALPGYPDGLLVLQDGRNRLPDAPQDFKLVDWRAVAAVLGLAPDEAQGAR